jgi:peptidoglycan-N-acetylglucosamine deacetylase
MLKYQKIYITFFLIMSAFIIADIFIRVPFLLYAGTILAFVVLMAWGSADIRSGMFCKVMWRGNRGTRTIALTFDDGPDKTVTPAILDQLAKENVRAAFFCTGKKAEENPDLLRRIDREGHIVGGHSYSHSFFFDLSGTVKMLEEMNKTEDAISRCISKRIRLFRPPYGVTNPPLAKAAGKKKYHVVGWSLRSKDTVIKDVNDLLKRVTGKVKPGDIVLFHDTQSQTVDILGKFIKFVKENQIDIERLDKLVGIEAYE